MLHFRFAHHADVAPRAHAQTLGDKAMLVPVGEFDAALTLASPRGSGYRTYNLDWSDGVRDWGLVGNVDGGGLLELLAGHKKGVGAQPGLNREASARRPVPRDHLGEEFFGGPQRRLGGGGRQLDHPCAGPFPGTRSGRPIPGLGPALK